jgi:hypothetical protein
LTYLAIFDGAQSHWSVSREELLASLRVSWPEIQAKVESGRDETHDITWSAQGEAGLIDVYHHRDGTCLYLDGAMEDAASFAVWYRTLVPPAVELIFCDDSYSFSVRIASQMTAADLVDAVNAEV